MSSDKVKFSQMCWYLFFKKKYYTCDFVKGLKLNLGFFCLGKFLKNGNLQEPNAEITARQLLPLIGRNA